MTTRSNQRAPLVADYFLLCLEKLIQGLGDRGVSNVHFPILDPDRPLYSLVNLYLIMMDQFEVTNMNVTLHSREYVPILSHRPLQCLLAPRVLTTLLEGSDSIKLEEMLRNGISSAVVAGLTALLAPLEAQLTLPSMAVSIVANVSGYKRTMASQNGVRDGYNLTSYSR